MKYLPKSVILLFLICFSFILNCSQTKSIKNFDYSGGETFKGRLEIEGLKANNRYLLCINGKPGRPGNEILYNNYQIHENEGYYDFKEVNSDNNGNLNTTFDIELPEGKYEVKFAIKELPNYKWIEISSIVIFNIERKIKK